MRWLLLLLLIANVLVFGWWRQGWFVDEAPPQELRPESLRVVPLERLGGPSPTRP